jgi:hypothetical protein
VHLLPRQAALRCSRHIFLLLVGLLFEGHLPFLMAQTSTTLLTLSSVSVPQGAPIILTATVDSGGGQVTSGIVNFYQLIGTREKLLLSSQQIAGGGHAAIVKYTFGVGTSTVEADFLATNTYAGSTSSQQTVTVTGQNTTTTTITSSGSAGNYTLTGTVTAFGTLAPTRQISFEDQTNSNAVIATGTLDTTTLASSFTAIQSCPTQNCVTGSNPYSIASADLNGDGILDLAVANNDGSINIFLGNGHGTFASGWSYTSGSAFYAIAIGDFNRDGVPDLAVAIYGNNTIGIFLGNGDGTFQNQTPYAAGSHPSSVAVGDFNNDGILDLAVADYSGGLGSVSILLGVGDGTFQAAVSYSAGNSPYSVAVADFNNDGKLDLVVANAFGYDISVLLGNGNGTFQSQNTYAVQGSNNHVWGVTVADFDEDGHPDIAVTTDQNVEVFLGNGNGTFQSPGTYGGDNTPYAITTGDFNGDGHIDLAVTNTNSRDLSVLLGKGDGTFASTVNYSTSISPQSVAVGDFNGDGRPDLAVVTGVTSDMNIFLGRQSESATANSVSILGTGTHNLLASYPGDTNYGASVSSTAPLTAQQGATNLTLPSQTISSIYGSPVTIQGTFTPVSANVAASNFQLLIDSVVRPTATTSYANGAVTASYSQLSGGTHTAVLKFLGTTDYASSISNGESISDAQVTPTVTWATPAAITYGTTLSAAQLNASSTVAGSFAYTPAVGTALSAGTQTLSVSLTPTDTIDYNHVSQTVQLIVNKVTPTISWAAPAAIAYGTALSPTQLNASSTVAGSFAYSPPAGTVSNAGTQTLSVTFTPTDTTNYNSVTTTTTITVGQAIPAVTWTIPAAIPYGTALGATQLNASSTVAGTFAYSPAAGTILTVGTQTLSAILTPADTTTYTSATKTVVLLVNKAATTITLAGNASFIAPGQTITLTGTIISTAGGTPTGTVIFYDGSTQLGVATLTNGQADFTASALAPGVHALTAIYSGDGNFNGTTAGGSNGIMVTVTPLQFNISPTSGNTQTVIPGNSVNYGFSIAPFYGRFPGPVTFTVTGLPAGATYSFNPSSLPASSTGENVVLTIQTSKSSQTALLWRRSGTLSLALLLFPLLGDQRLRRAGNLRGRTCLPMLLLLIAASLFSLSGCGTGAQAAKDYQVIVSVASENLQQSASVTLHLE